jgi:zinc protease
MEVVIRGWLLALLLTCLCCLPARGNSSEGAQLIVHPDPNAPLVAIEVWVRAGSANETRETSGAAHLLEHLIFKGTAQHPPGALDEAIEAAGGILEASTERDWTRYRMAVLPDRWEAVLRLLLQHLLQPAPPESELVRERELMVRDEYALYRADALRVARDALYAQAYGEHPYALPPFGRPDSLGKLTREQLLAFHARYYRPERMVIVVVGAVDAERVQRVVREIVPISQQENERLAASSVPKPPRKIAQLEVGQSDLFVIGVPAPSAESPQAMLAAELIRLMLAEPSLGLLWAGASPPFVSLQSDYLPRRQPSLMLFSFQPYPDAGGDWQGAIRRCWAEAVRQLLTGQARQLLEGAKRWLIARHEQAMRDPIERARRYALYAMLGLPTLPDEYAERVQSLTAEQVEAVARAMFDPESETSFPLQQEPRLERRISPSPLDKGGAAVIGTARSGSEGQVRTPSIFRQTLASGVRVIALRQPGARQVVVQMLIATGIDAEQGFPAGTAELTARMLFTTTQNETGATLASRIARSGGSLQLQWEPIGVRITAVAEPATLENVLSLLREGVVRAEFERDALQRALQAAIAERRARDATHELPLYDALLRQLGYASLYAPVESIQRVRLEHIRAFYQRFYRPDRFVMVIAGDLPIERLTELTQRYFGTMERVAARPTALTPSSEGGDGAPNPLFPPYQGGSRRGDVSIDSSHGLEAKPFITAALASPEGAPTLYIGFAMRVAVRSPEDYARLLLLQAVFCEGKASLLFRQFREGEGMGYAFGGQVIVWHGEGLLLGFLQLGASRSEQRERLLQRLQALSELKPPTSDALARAAALVEGRWRRDQLDMFERTRRLAIAEASGIGYLAEEQLPSLVQAVQRTALEPFGVK